MRYDYKRECPRTWVAFSLAPGSAPCTLITASDGVSGDPTFVRCRGSKTAIFTVGANDLSFDCPGMMLLFR